MRNLNTILAICLFFTLLSCDNSTKKKSDIKTIEQTIETKEITVNKQGVIETKKEANSTSTKQKNTIGFIKNFDIKVGYNDTLVLRNTIEYHLNNGIIYIKEFYPNKKLKSESYWVNNITPVYQIKQYKEDGKIQRIIDKSIGKYDLHYVLNKVGHIKKLRNQRFKIYLSDKTDDFENKTWIINYNHEEYNLGASGNDILIDSKTGRVTSQIYSISDQPTNLNRPTPDQLPTFPGDIKTFEKFVANSIEVPDDSLVNAEVHVLYNVDTYGNTGNFTAYGGTDYLNNEVLKIAKKMPNWIAAEDHNTDGACNVQGEDYGKYTFAFSVFFRRFE